MTTEILTGEKAGNLGQFSDSGQVSENATCQNFRGGPLVGDVAFARIHKAGHDIATAIEFGHRACRGSPEITPQGSVRPSFTLRHAQGERVGQCLRWGFAVRAEPAEARCCQ